MVGDDDQSIYRFRGATIENILNFERIYPGTKTIRLEQNYRSTSNILNAANCVIQHNTERKGKTLWTSNGEGDKVQVYTAENEQDEASHIADVIGQHLKEGGHLADHAILYRMNAQSAPIESYFTRAGIPHKIVGGQRFNDRKEVKDIHSYMSIVANPPRRGARRPTTTQACPQDRCHHRGGHCRSGRAGGREHAGHHRPCRPICKSSAAP